MSVIWSGITEEGAVVPVQVTEEGKVVAIGDGPQGDYLPITGGELTGDLEVDGSITAAGGKYEINGTFGNVSASSGNFRVDAQGSALVGTTGWNLTDAKIGLSGIDGSAEFANYITATGYNAEPANSVDSGLTLRNPDNAAITIDLKANGSGIFGSTYKVGIRPFNGATADQLYIDTPDGTRTFSVLGNGSGTFAGDVVIGSRGSKWLIRESNGVAMLIEQTRRGQIEPRKLEKVRDLPNELDLVEAALNEVMAKLKMVPPAGWPVWDGQDEVPSDNDKA